MVDGRSAANAHARTSLHEIKSQLSAISDEKSCLKTLTELFAALFKESKNISNRQEFVFDNLSKQLLLTKHYSEICSSVLGLAASTWFAKFSKLDDKKVFDLFFIYGPPKEVFIALTVNLNKSW